MEASPDALTGLLSMFLLIAFFYGAAVVINAAKAAASWATSSFESTVSFDLEFWIQQLKWNLPMALAEETWGEWTDVSIGPV